MTIAQLLGIVGGLAIIIIGAWVEWAHLIQTVPRSAQDKSDKSQKGKDSPQ